MAMSGLGGRPFAPPPASSRFAVVRPPAGTLGASRLRGGRLERGHFGHGRLRHRRFFVRGFGWVDSDYCIWPYNWGPWCYDY
jgi:hypothetical protein